MCCGILLVLHVSFTNGVCYIMIRDALLLFCCRQQKEGEEGRQREEEEGGEASHWVSCLIFYFFIPCGTVFVIEMSMLMYCRG